MDITGQPVVAPFHEGKFGFELQLKLLFGGNVLIWTDDIAG